MDDVAKRLLLIQESQTIGMAKRARELAAKGVDVINLSFGEPDFRTPEHIREAAKQAIDEGYSYYTPVPGYPDLREAISAKFERENGLQYAPDQIVVSTGAKHSIMNVVMSLINPGDEVLIPTPYWVSYSEMVKLTEGVPVYIPAKVDTNFKINASQVEAAITPKTKAFIFSTPCNPTGSVYSKQELRAIAEVLSKHNIYVIADEIYEHINFVGKHESIAQFDFIKDKVITVNGVSKAFAMTGWRIGYIGAPKWIAQACEKLQSQFTSGSCSIAQRAALAAISTDLTPTIQMKEAFLRRRDLVLKLAAQIPGIRFNVPEGAFYLFPDVSSYFGKRYGDTVIGNAQDLCLYLLSEGHVSVVTGEAFGDGDYIRISYAASDEKLIQAFERMKAALEKLN